MSGSTLANLVGQMRREGIEDVVLEIDGQEVEISLVRPPEPEPLVQPICLRAFLHPMARLVKNITLQNRSNN